MEIVWVPLLLGILLLVAPPLRKSPAARTVYVLVSLVLASALSLRAAVGPGFTLTLGYLAEEIPIAVQVDGLSRLFLALCAGLWLVVGIFSFGYLAKEERAGWFFGVYLVVFGTMAGIGCAANLFTLYLFFEMMSLTSSLLVFFPCTHESAMAGLKYLFYSIGGAFLGLVGIFFLARMNAGLFFRPGGVALYTEGVGGSRVLLLMAFLMIVGLGAKAGMFPLHGWLPTAHPVAPAPASAVLSGLIVKAGVFFIIRVVYYIIGAEALRGTWVQYAWLALSLLTVFMGSMLAYLEPVLKKRLAYSTVSQVSYILFGLALLTEQGMMGALLQTVFHAVTKCGLFMCAGSYITQTGCTRVSDLKGIGKTMPVTTGCFAMFGLSLVGIPPFSGFLSKWYLATGTAGMAAGNFTALQSTPPAQLSVFALVGPAVLLASALLTAGYLFMPVVRGFFVPEKGKGTEAPPVMTLPVVVLAVLTLALGLFSEPLLGFLTPIARSVL